MSKGRVRQRGAALVELGILLIPMFILLMGLLESGRAFYQKGQLTKLTEASARYLSRGVDIVDESTCSINATEWNTVLGRATNLLQYGDVDSTGLAELLEGVSLSVTSTLQNGTGGVSACVISVSASMTYQSFFGSQGLLFYFDGIQLRANTQEVYVGA
jgi:Flp pilus assembly protein TadG